MLGLVVGTLGKIARVRQMIVDRKLACDVEVDGGIDTHTAPAVVAAGANVLVAGTSIFGETDGAAPAISRLRAAVKDVHPHLVHTRRGRSDHGLLWPRRADSVVEQQAVINGHTDSSGSEKYNMNL